MPVYALTGLWLFRPSVTEATGVVTGEAIPKCPVLWPVTNRSKTYEPSHRPLDHPSLLSPLSLLTVSMPPHLKCQNLRITTLYL